jgi:hypothetical protein
MRRHGFTGEAITAFMRSEGRPVSLAEIYVAVNAAAGEKVPRSSVRSHLNVHVPKRYERLEKGTYRLATE